jgi:hypothetical protein
MKWGMLVSGLLTCTMLHAVLAPQRALRSAFGETAEGAAVEIVTRNWGALIVLVGAMLIYGAFRPAVRPLVLVVAGVSKLTFIALVLAQGSRYLGGQAGIAVAVDTVMVLLFALYLFAGRGASNAVP